MAFIWKDRVRDTTTTTGTGAKTVSGSAPATYRTFSTVCAVSDTLPAFIAHRTADEWEVGIYTYTASNQLTNASVIASSNAGSAVNFTTGTKDVVLSEISNSSVLNGLTSTITVGYSLTPYNGGTQSSGTYTPVPANGNYQYYTNNGAHVLANPASDCAIDILITNGASAGAITFTTFTVSANTGDALTTTNGNRFIVSIRRINAVSTYTIKALQ